MTRVEGLQDTCSSDDEGIVVVTVEPPPAVDTVATEALSNQPHLQNVKKAFKWSVCALGATSGAIASTALIFSTIAAISLAVGYGFSMLISGSFITATIVTASLISFVAANKVAIIKPIIEKQLNIPTSPNLINPFLFLASRKIITLANKLAIIEIKIKRITPVANE